MAACTTAVVDATTTSPAAGGAVRCRASAALELPDGSVVPAAVELTAGRHRYRLGKRLTRGKPWWYGWVLVASDAIGLADGTEVVMRFANGRTAVATVEHSSPAKPGRTSIRGIGTPPFALR